MEYKVVSNIKPRYLYSLTNSISVSIVRQYESSEESRYELKCIALDLKDVISTS